MTNPWQLVGYIPQGPQGVQGDRYMVFSSRTEPNSFVTLNRQLEVFDPGTETYTPSGAAEEFATLYDGWVHVGFYMPTAVDNGNGTVTFYKQWYCRESAESNVFNPEGPIEEIGSAVLPPGPPGGFYQITSTNPDDHVAYFFREFHSWDPQANGGAGGFVASGNVEQFGGVIAPEGPQGIQGVKGDYYLLTADNPVDEPHTVRLYRQPHSFSGAPIGTVEQIGQATALEGYVPQHQWSGTSIRFQNSDGSWGPYVDLQGSPGLPGSGNGAVALFGAGDEFYELGFLAWKLANEEINRMLFHWGAVAFVIDSFSFLASLRGFSLPDITNIAVGPMLDYLASNAGRDATARALYCAMIPYRDFSNPSLDSMHDQHATGDWPSLVLNQDWEEAVIYRIVRWTRDERIKARTEMGVILNNAYYDPAIDYTSMPCTPQIGTWSRVYDFTIDAQGWVAGYEGIYVAGEGWKPTTNNPSGDTAIAELHNLPADCEVTYIEMLATNVTHGPGGYASTSPRLRIQHNSTTLTDSLDQGGLVPVTWNGSVTGGLIRAAALYMATSQVTRIVRMSLSGNGTPPP